MSSTLEHGSQKSGGAMPPSLKSGRAIGSPASATHEYDSTSFWDTPQASQSLCILIFFIESLKNNNGDNTADI